MAFIDYYKILGVDKNIAQEDVQAAYRKRVKMFHPDLHPNDPKAKAKFQALNEAYQVISDPGKRKKYDQYGEHWRDANDYCGSHNGHSCGTGSPFERFDFGNGNRKAGGFSSFFRDLFGSDAFNESRYSSRQQDMSANITIDLYTALLGGEVAVQLEDGSRIKLIIKPETQNGTKVRLRNKGYYLGNGKRSDLIITYNVSLPTGLNDRQKELLRQIQQLSL